MARPGLPRGRSERSIGASVSGLLVPCSDVAPPASAYPPPRAGRVALAVSLSGGGFRASLAGLGVLRFLASAGLLGDVRIVSSVSGGGVTNGLFATRYAELAAAGFAVEVFDELVTAPLVEQVSTRSLTGDLVRNIWRLPGRATRTTVLADALDRRLFGGRLLEELPRGCRFIFNAANVTTGVRLAMEAERLGDYVMGTLATEGTGMSLSRAVAASAAVPGFFPALVLDGLAFPCSKGLPAKLLDGGAYDNMGLEPIDDLPEVCVVALNAGGIFRAGVYGGVPLVRDLQRANSILYRQSTALRTRSMVERFKVREDALRSGKEPPTWGRRGVLFGLATTLKPTAEWTSVGIPDDRDPQALADVATSFGRFEPELCRRLVDRGTWLAGASLARFQRDLLGAELPRIPPY